MSWAKVLVKAGVKVKAKEINATVGIDATLRRPGKQTFIVGACTQVISAWRQQWPSLDCSNWERDGTTVMHSSHRIGKVRQGGAFHCRQER